MTQHSIIQLLPHAFSVMFADGTFEADGATHAVMGQQVVVALLQQQTTTCCSDYTQTSLCHHHFMTS